MAEQPPAGIADHDERRILRAFDDALAIDEPLPDALVAAAQELYAWRTVDAELLELLVDSASEDLAMTRDGERLQRFIAFGDAERGVHFECADDADGFTVRGVVVPAGRYLVRADRPSVDLVAESDEFGSFVLRGLPPGSTRLSIRAVETGGSMVTPWFVLQA